MRVDRWGRWRQQVRRVTRPAWFGTLRRTSPLSSSWGFDRGTPVDRYSVERFLAGVAQEELAPRELAVNDPDFRLIVGVRAVKT